MNISGIKLQPGLFRHCIYKSITCSVRTKLWQYELKSFVAMATYWVPDFPNIKGISGYLQRSIFIYLQMVPRMYDPAGI